MAGIVEFEVFRDFLGVAADAPEIDDCSRLYDAIGTRIRRITRRDFEGDEGGSYDEVIRIRGALEFRLAHVPVEAITSLRAVEFDGTEADPYLATQWRLEDAQTGLVRLVRRSEYLRAVYTTTGEIPADLPQAYLDWGKARWDERTRPAVLASYQTGGDGESYFEALAGRPPRDVVAILLGNRHDATAGVI